MNEKIKTEKAIQSVKEFFERELAVQLNLVRVSSPLAVEENTGINDDLNGVERAVKFNVKGMNGTGAVVVQSLAKWKRVRIMELGIEEGLGIITDMRALRPDEVFSPLHSIYVDQWDWEKRISEGERSVEFLKSVVVRVYEALKSTESYVCAEITGSAPVLPPEIRFIHAEELARIYPSLTPGERERVFIREHGAAFIIGIGATLSDGRRHDGRAPDYDDWSTMNEDGFYGLNGDIIVWNQLLECPFELSSMGVRVNREALLRQLSESGCMGRSSLAYHKMLLSGKLPQTIGGGIGQSRVCMFMLQKSHIGQVQVGIWPEPVRKKLAEEGIVLM